MTDIPDRVRHLTASVAGDFHVIAEHSWPGPDRPGVWEVQGSDGKRWFVKRHAGPKGHRREVEAYQRWTAALGAGRAPTLAAADAEARAIVITRVAGRSVRDHPLDTQQELAAFQQAGYLLALLNSAHVGTAVEPSEQEWAADVEKMLSDATLYLQSPDVALLRGLTRERPPAAPSVVSHADFQPRNWIWDASERLLRLIDFERTCIEPAVRRDLPRLELRILPARPKLREAFYDGHGRQLTPEELHACAAYGALDVVSALKWGLEHRDVETVDAAHTMLENLRAQRSGPSRRFGTR
ncbi:aminoglycoside phosphotransferase family protein [Streptomyces sp. NBC_00885]|uniref:aminoglycoside phosphotransferase family protein n=1 Tax=Streptomyces sp. NBC_00885 TaxID=2975857 RepID=UPI00386C669B|nr:aminoglycoside phosphotransferase family protein [Streptomyces sp. NBC_00885]